MVFFTEHQDPHPFLARSAPDGLTSVGQEARRLPSDTDEPDQLETERMLGEGCPNDSRELIGFKTG